VNADAVTVNPAAIRFFVRGEPKGQPRPRAFSMRVADRMQTRVYDPKTADGWKLAVVDAAKLFLPATPFVGPVQAQLIFMFPRPKSHFGSGKNATTLKPNAPKWHAAKPDADNLAKAVMDALTSMGGLWEDDDQVANLEVLKFYTNDQPAGCAVFIQSLPLVTQFQMGASVL
jgi:Holliday junction resolvase RusA-like endonuclease